MPCDLYDAAGVPVLRVNRVVSDVLAWRHLVEAGLYLDLSMQRRLEPPSVCACLEQAVRCMDDVFRGVEYGGRLSASVNRAVALINAAWARSRDVLIAHVMLYRGPMTPARHAVHTVCFVQAVMLSMGMDERVRQSVLSAALTLHLETTAPVADEVSMVSHIPAEPDNADARWQAFGIHDASWISVLAHANEAMRTHYRQRTTDTLVIAGQLVALADLYCNRIAGTADELPGDSRSVLRDLLIERGQHFDALLASHFIRALGVYPVGSVVSLRNGEIAVVCKQSDQIDAPWVCSLVAPLGMSLDPPKLRDTRDPIHGVRASLGPTDLLDEVDMEAIWGESAREFCYLCLPDAEGVAS